MFKSMWNWLKKLTFIIWLLFMVIFGAGLAVKNSQIVTVSLFNYEFPDASLGLVIGISLLIGAFLGFFTNFLMLKPGLVVKKRALAKANKEVDRLRVSQLKE